MIVETAGIVVIIIKRQLIRRSNMASDYKGAVQCSLFVLRKQLVSEVRTWGKDES